MGLASKLAATQGAAAPGGAPPAAAPNQSYGASPAQPQQGQYGQPPQQQQQGQYGQPPQGQQQGQYGQPPQQQGQQGQYGAPPAPGGRPPSGAPPGAQPQQGQGQYGQPPQSQSQYGQPPQGQQQGQYGQPPQGQGQQSQGQYGQPPQGQSQYGQPPQHQGQGQYGQPPKPQGQQGAPPAYGQPPQGQHGAPAPAAGGAGATGDSRFLLSQLQQCVQDQNLQAFYPPGSLEPIAQKVAQSGALDKIAAEWRMPKELASDLVKLSLFDIILYVDDSGSMAFEQGGERIDDLKLIMSRVAYAASLFDQDGIQVRFMNSRVEGNGITNEPAALALLQQVKFSGLTPLGTQLDQKILQPLVLGPARMNRLEKPILIIAITDGTPAGEDKSTIFTVIQRADAELKRTRYGPDAVSYQFAQVGDDLKAQAFLGEMDNHPVIGGLIDCTSNFESEQEEMMRKSGIDLTPELWLVKLLMGGIDSSYDSKDE